jgi:arsenate reductase
VPPRFCSGRLVDKAIRNFMPNGTVKFFNAAKGFGFITPDEGGKDIFVPTASSTGVAGLKAGQRVAFETQPDAKGPKAVNLTLLSVPQAPKPEKARVPMQDQAPARLTFYHDPDCEWSDTVLAELRDAGQDPGVVDYITAPPTRDELKRLSMLLKDGDQSLVRKYDNLFQSLQLDDRFLSENEFWDSVVEHPSLINGPILASPAKARICRSESDVKAFLTDAPVSEAAPRPKSKGLSARLLSLMAGESVSPAPPRAKEPEKTESAPVKKEPVAAAPVAKIKLELRATLAKKAAVKPAAKPAPKPGKPVSKAKPAKKAAPAKGKR